MRSNHIGQFHHVSKYPCQRGTDRGDRFTVNGDSDTSQQMSLLKKLQTASEKAIRKIVRLPTSAWSARVHALPDPVVNTAQSVTTCNHRALLLSMTYRRLGKRTAQRKTNHSDNTDKIPQPFCSERLAVLGRCRIREQVCHVRV